MKRSPRNLLVWSAISLTMILVGAGTPAAFSEPTQTEAAAAALQRPNLREFRLPEPQDVRRNA